MALPGNTFTQYDAIGNREDLSDIIYDISPTETTCVSGSPRTSPPAVTHERTTEAHPAATPLPHTALFPSPQPGGHGIVDVQDLIVIAEHLFEEFPPVEPGE